MGLRILGLDVATSTGICFVDRSRPASEWRCLAVQSEGDNGEDKAADLGLFLFAELVENRPDFAAIEMPQRSVAQFGRKKTDPLTGQETTETTINPNALQLSALAGAVVTALEIRRIPWGLVAPATWRSAYFGRGQKPVDGDWKAAAVRQAELQKVALPPTVKAARDAAEAIGIAMAWERCTFIPTRHQAAFMALRQGKAVAA